MSEEKKLEDLIKEKLENLVEKVETKASKDEIGTLKHELDALMLKANEEVTAKFEKAFGSLEEIVKKHGELIESAKVSKKEEEVASLGELMVKAYQDNIEKIKAIKGQGMIEIELKAAGTMTTSNYSGGTVGLSTLEPGFTRVQRRQPFLRQLSNTQNTSSKLVVWVEQTNPDPGAAGMTGEGSAKTQTDFDLVEASKQVRKVTAYIKVSTEMLEDIDFVRGEINGELMELVNLKLDEQHLSGDDTGNNLKGILEYATAFSAGSLAGTVDEANNYDVLRAAIAQITAANFSANYILLNPVDVAKMDMEKGTDGHYVLPPFISQSGMMIKGVRVIENNGVTAGDFVVGDFTKSNLRIRKDAAIQVGYENDDFTKNLITIIAECRAVHYIKSQHTTAFVTGTFSTAAAALETA